MIWLCYYIKRYKRI